MRGLGSAICAITLGIAGCGSADDSEPESLTVTADEPPVDVAQDEPPLTDQQARAFLGTYEPGVISIDLSDAMTDLTVRQIQWFHGVTGIAAPELSLDGCPDPDFDCIRYGQPNGDAVATTWHRLESGVQSKRTVIRELPRTEPEALRIVRHEYAHWWLFPWAGVDGHGHSPVDSDSLMNPGLDWQRCPGFSAEEMAAVCELHECGTLTVECEQ
jgi:hypothetical protein